MNSNYNACLNQVLIFEGGFVDDPADPGGRTNKGVTQKTYDAWLRKNGKPAADVKFIPNDALLDIYKTGFWNVVDCDHLWPGVDLAIFDYGVNSGPARATKVRPKVTVDPSMATVQVKSICASRSSFVNAIKNFSKFRKGVLSRVAKVEAVALTMIGMTAPVAAGTQVKVTKAILADAHEDAQKSIKRANSGAGATGGTAITTGSVGATTAAAGNSTSTTIVFTMIAIVAAIAVAYFIYNAVRNKHRVDALDKANAALVA